MKIRPAVTTATAVLGLLAAAFATTAAGAAASPPGSHHKIQRLVVLQPRYDEGVRPNISRSGGASKASAPSIPLFHTTVTDGATTFPYTMVGKNPFTSHANGAANVTTVIVPVVVKLTNGDTFNPTVADS
jgi:hypothetical protein